MPKKRSKMQQAAVDAAKNMPPLFHKLPDTEFDIRKARTIWWLVKQPEILKLIWSLVTSAKAITYDPNTGKWQGVSFVPEEIDDE